MTAVDLPQLEISAAQLPLYKLLLLWTVGGAVLFTALGSAPVTRTQEARVLETARQMLGAGFDGWMVPHINGRLRLEKPPLCYWMAAGMYHATGTVNETVGRIPTAIIGWLLLGLTFAFANRLFDQRVALATAAAMLGSYMFFRHMRLAETDAPSALFVTLAIYSIWRAGEGSFAWHYVAATSMGLAVMAKGGPALYPVLFMAGYALVERKWKLVGRFFTSGAIVLVAVIALPWFAYIAATLGTSVFRDELATVTGGRNHWDWPVVYIPLVLVAATPWTGVLPLALVQAIRKWKVDARVRLLLLWCGSIIVPLCIIGNKQGQYLVPLMPPLMILIGWTLATATDRRHELYNWMSIILIGTLVVLAGGAAAVMLVSWQQHEYMTNIDAATFSAIVACVMAAGILGIRRGTAMGFAALAVGTAALLPLIVGVWMSDLPRPTTRTIAADIRRYFGDGPYVFYGPNTSLVLCFNLRAAIPWAQTADELPALVQPGTIVIAQTKSNTPAPPLPAQYVLREQLKADEQVFDLYEYRPGKR